MSDGPAVHVRALRADDCARLARLFEQLSDESVYFRFFSPTPRSTAAQLELKALDGTDHVALVALVGDEIVAVARYDRLSSTEGEAEVALEVADAQQGRGIGTLLLHHLAVVAREHHIRTLSAVVLPGNARLFRMLADTGWPLERHFDAGAIRLSVRIDRSPDPSQATSTVAVSPSLHRPSDAVSPSLHRPSGAVSPSLHRPSGAVSPESSAANDSERPTSTYSAT
jgi:GNAT superfamily N-acetyltransferase